MWDDMLLSRKNDNYFSTKDLVMIEENLGKSLSKYLIYKVSWKSQCHHYPIHLIQSKDDTKTAYILMLEI